MQKDGRETERGFLIWPSFALYLSAFSVPTLSLSLAERETDSSELMNKTVARMFCYSVLISVVIDLLANKKALEGANICCSSWRGTIIRWTPLINTAEIKLIEEAPSTKLMRNSLD